MRTCTKCREVKALDAFSRCARVKDGRAARCKECEAAYRAENADSIRAKRAARYAENPEPTRARAKAYYAANAERAKARAKAYRAADPERERAHRTKWRKANPEKFRATIRRWEKAHPDSHTKALARHHAAHPDARRVRNAKWVRANPASVLASKARRRARVLNAPGAGVTTAGWREALAESVGLCIYCSERHPLEMDHVDPLSRGGAHDPMNIAPACVSCNRSKNDSILILWMAQRMASRAQARAA